jgi:hypothetical protein
MKHICTSFTRSLSCATKLPLFEKPNIHPSLDFCRVLSAEDYALVLGLPGTGKTSTIATAVKALIDGGKSVLITSYTNSAVDNILVKLAASGVPILRLGRPQGVHTTIKPYMLGGELYPQVSVSNLRNICRSAPLVGK